MRIYLPLTASDRPVLERAGRVIDLESARPGWAVTAEARGDRPGQDEEDLEYEALQDAAHVALRAVGPTSRALVIAADVPDRTIEPAEEGGAFGLRLREATPAEIASFHVTELDAAAAEQDDTDPALLWFDASEGTEALAFLDGSSLD